MVTYVNFKEDMYYLHEGLTKKGNKRYWFSKSQEGVLTEQMPKGYEVYEEPNGIVYLVRTDSIVTTPTELAVVQRCIPDGLDVKVVAQKNVITVHYSEPPQMPSLKEYFDPFYSEPNHTPFYMPMMRFKLVNKKERLFIAERFCFRSSIDDWIDISCSDDSLQELAEEFCPYLGTEEFYDLC